MKIHWLTAVLAVAVLALGSSSANASLLTPGSPSNVVPPDPDLFSLATSTIKADTGVEAFTPTAGGLTGTFREVVVQETAGANILGGLTFVYQFLDSTVDVGRMASNNWTSPPANSPVDVGSNVGTAANSLLGHAGDVNTTTVDWNTNGTLGFNFATTVGPGQYSWLLIIRTSNTQWGGANITLLDGGASASVTGFSPAAVPEPSTMAIAGLGALGLIGYGIRRRRGA